jgi:integrase
MGSLFLRQEFFCTVCRVRLRRTAERTACEDSGHEVRTKTSKVWWIKYSRGGKSYLESSRSQSKKDAKALLQSREGDIVQGKPVTPKIGQLRFEEAAQDLENYYAAKRKRSYSVCERRIRLHLSPYFAGRRMSEITSADADTYIKHRQTTLTVLVRKAQTIRLPDGSVQTTPEQRRPASDAEINRELATLRQMFTHAVRAGKLLYRPHIGLLPEDNVRTGFFEPEQLAAVLAHLPDNVRPVISFAHLTGWRIVSEVLPLQWRQVDFDAGEVRLDAGTTKNKKGRVFPLTAELRALLGGRRDERDELKRAGHITPWVFWRMVAEGRGGDKKPQPIISFSKAWHSACRAAGCPGRIPHDLRRTAIRNFVRNGVPERVAMRLTGHQTPSVFARYDIISDDDLRDAAKRLDTIAQHPQANRA